MSTFLNKSYHSLSNNLATSSQNDKANLNKSYHSLSNNLATSSQNDKANGVRLRDTIATPSGNLSAHA